MPRQLRGGVAAAVLLAAAAWSVSAAASDGAVEAQPAVRDRAAWLADLSAACATRSAALGCELWAACKVSERLRTSGARAV
jgi:hypothetical protein